MYVAKPFFKGGGWVDGSLIQKIFAIKKKKKIPFPKKNAISFNEYFKKNMATSSGGCYVYCWYTSMLSKISDQQ